MERPGEKLKRVRERLTLTYRDVEQASRQIAARRGRLGGGLEARRLAREERATNEERALHSSILAPSDGKIGNPAAVAWI